MAEQKAEKEKTQKKKETFESALKELEMIASRLESGKLGLDESIAEFEKGIGYARFCHEKLDEAERKIEIMQKGISGTVEKREVRIKKETGEIEEDEDLQGSLL